MFPLSPRSGWPAADAARHLQRLGAAPALLAPPPAPPRSPTHGGSDIVVARSEDGSRLYVVNGKTFVSRSNAEAWRRHAALEAAEAAQRAAVVRQFEAAADAAAVDSAAAALAPGAGALRAAPRSRARAAAL